MTSFVVMVDEVECDGIELVVFWGKAVTKKKIKKDFACCYPNGKLCETMTVFNSHGNWLGLIE